MNRNWRPITELRELERNYSGKSYTYSRLIKVRRNEHGEMEYRFCEEKEHHHYPEEYHTQFGTYISDNQGEFGGSLILPDGSSIGGNYEAAFDCGEAVYVIGSHAHFLIAGVSVKYFTGPCTYKTVYSGGDWDLFALLSEEAIEKESFYVEAYHVFQNTLYVLISGHIENRRDKEYRSCSRLLEIKEGKLENLLEFSEAFRRVQNMAVKDDKLDAAMDKMLVEIDLHSGEYKNYTFLSVEDEENLNSLQT